MDLNNMAKKYNTNIVKDSFAETIHDYLQKKRRANVSRLMEVCSADNPIQIKKALNRLKGMNAIKQTGAYLWEST